MEERENLYFIAIVPSKKVCDEVTAFKNDFAIRFQSKKALKVIPHITLKAPFKLPGSLHTQLLEWFNSLKITTPSFKTRLENFGAFKNRRSPVVYAHPVSNASLDTLQKEILSGFRNNYPQIPVSNPELEFNPHITVAYRDLQPALFNKAWEEYGIKKYSASFVVTNFHLLQHDGKAWNIISTFSLEPLVQ